MSELEDYGAEAYRLSLSVQQTRTRRVLPRWWELWKSPATEIEKVWLRRVIMVSSGEAAVIMSGETAKNLVVRCLAFTDCDSVVSNLQLERVV